MEGHDREFLINGIISDWLLVLLGISLWGSSQQARCGQWGGQWSEPTSKRRQCGPTTDARPSHCFHLKPSHTEAWWLYEAPPPHTVSPGGGLSTSGWTLSEAQGEYNEQLTFQFHTCFDPHVISTQFCVDEHWTRVELFNPTLTYSLSCSCFRDHELNSVKAKGNNALTFFFYKKVYSKTLY